MHGIQNFNIIPYKCWFIIREDLSYSYDRIFTIGIKNIILPFYSEFNNNIKQDWIDQGSKFETFTMFNINFIEDLEQNLIEGGHIHKWIYDGNTPVGILIEPSRYQFRDSILSSVLKLKEYQKCRLEQFNEISSENGEI